METISIMALHVSGVIRLYAIIAMGNCSHSPLLDMNMLAKKYVKTS